MLCAPCSVSHVLPRSVPCSVVCWVKTRLDSSAKQFNPMRHAMCVRRHLERLNQASATQSLPSNMRPRATCALLAQCYRKRHANHTSCPKCLRAARANHRYPKCRPHLFADSTAKPEGPGALPCLPRQPRTINPTVSVCAPLIQRRLCVGGGVCLLRCLV